MIATGLAHARAALVGNPSDGFGGATIAVPVRNFAATATAAEATAARGADPPLVEAAVRRFWRDAGCSAPPTVDVSVSTTIPREVGLGGSSAIVIAVLRALSELHRVTFEPDELAKLALACETEELGIAAGPQDRVVQAHDAPIYMEFSATGAHELVEPDELPPLFVAYCATSGTHSGDVHADLVRRYAAGDPAVRAAMRRLGTLATEGRSALAGGDHEAFGALMRESFEIRSRVVALEPRHARLIEIADEHAAAANFAGSGGAIVGIVPAAGVKPLAGALAAEGFTLVLADVR